jgi:putative exosortase-associated protein (TIGR04073 family)
MKAFKSKPASALSAGLLFLSLTCSAYAGAPGEMSDNPGSYTADAGKGAKHRSYGEKIGHKLLRGFANMTTAVVEVPKNVINATNAGGIGGEGSNFIWGLAGGVPVGVLNMIGRTGSGIVDVLTFPLPTKSIPLPEYPWQQFNEDTAYGGIFVYDAD